MATVTIPWGDTIGGNIILTGVGESLFTAKSDTPNIGPDREKRVTLQTTNVGPKASVTIAVRQSGIMEPLMASDGVVTDKDGGVVYVPKGASYLMASDGVLYDLNMEIITIK